MVISPGAYDVQWNAVWRVETRDDEGWTAEFGFLEFCEVYEDGGWGGASLGVNWRIRRLGKEYWHAVDPARQGLR